MLYRIFPLALFVALQLTAIQVAAFFVRAPSSTTTAAAAATATTHSRLLPPLRAGGNGDETKHVLVTGGNKGIGRAICERLLTEHPEVTVLLGSRDAGRGSQAVTAIEEAVGQDKCKDRLHVISLDTSSPDSVQAAVKEVQKITSTLYGIINNAGIMKRGDVVGSNNINYLGPRRVNDAFMGMMQRPGGRIVNIASASGPIFVSGCSNPALVEKLSKPWTTSIKELDDIATDPNRSNGGDAYGFSKALVNAYTWWLAKENEDLIINSVTPGYILTDMTRGAGASNPPSKGAIPPVWLLMSEELTQVPTGRYYGSDCKRSPLDAYRGPGDPVYEGPDGP